MNFNFYNKKGIISLLFFFFLVITLLPFSSASFSLNGDTSFLGKFKQNECVNLIQTCSNCSFVNISSVTYPDSLLASGQVEMVKQGLYYYYTFCNTDKQGTYLVNGYGDLDGTNEVFSYSFVINPVGGLENNTYIFLILIILSIGLLILALVSKNNLFSIISGLSFMVSGVYSMIYGFGLITNVYTRMGSFIILGIGMILTIISSLDLMENFSDEKEISYSEEE